MIGQLIVVWGDLIFHRSVVVTQRLERFIDNVIAEIEKRREVA